MIIQAEEQNLSIVSDITQQTISVIYPKYQPVGAVASFRALHNDRNNLADSRKGIVFLLKDNDEYVGTVNTKC